MPTCSTTLIVAIEDCRESDTTYFGVEARGLGCVRRRSGAEVGWRWIDAGDSVDRGDATLGAGESKAEREVEERKAHVLDACVDGDGCGGSGCTRPADALKAVGLAE